MPMMIHATVWGSVKTIIMVLIWRLFDLTRIQNHKYKRRRHPCFSRVRNAFLAQTGRRVQACGFSLKWCSACLSSKISHPFLFFVDKSRSVHYNVLDEYRLSKIWQPSLQSQSAPRFLPKVPQEVPGRRRGDAL